MLSVSIVIPTLQEERRIGRLLSALRAQDYPGEVEVIVVDGGSRDGTVCEVGGFPEARLIRRESANVSAQRNAGAAAAANDLLVFLDADNAPGPRFLSRLAAAYDRRPFAVACPWFLPASRSPAIHAVFASLNCLFWLSQWRYHTGAGVCIALPRETFRQAGGFDEALHLGEDVHLIRRAARLGRHRHLPILLPTSARRFEANGVWATARLYARISPLLLAGRFDRLQELPYEPVRNRPTR